MAFVQIATSVTILNSGLVGYSAVSFTANVSQGMIVIAAGSAIEISGSFFKAETDITPNASSWSVLATGPNVYLCLLPSGTAGSQILTAEYTSSAPIWSSSKQGWYSSGVSSIRHIAVCSKESSTTNSGRRLLDPNSIYSVERSYGSNTIIGFGASPRGMGNLNAVVGYQAMMVNTGNNNSCLGFQALSKNTTGGNNTSVGSGSLGNNTTGSYNTAIGSESLLTSTTGTNCTGIGYQSNASSATASNEITLGNASISTLRCQVTSITALSDRRDKTDIENLKLGLDFINDLKAITHKWDKREWYENYRPDGSKKDSKIHAGFIAQDVEDVMKKHNAEWLDLVLHCDNNKLELSMGKVFPILVKAVQELSAQVNELRNKR